MITGFIAGGLMNGIIVLALSFFQGILVIVFLFILYILRGLGAGDIKLYGVIGIYKGFKFSILNFAMGIIICSVYIIMKQLLIGIKRSKKIRMMPSTTLAYFINILLL